MVDRALIVGLGSIGLRHLRLLREALPNAEIWVLRHSECDESVEYADKCTTNIKEARAFQPEIAIIASPAPFHLETAAQLAEDGTHLLIEKPLSVSTAGVEAFLTECEKKNVLVQVGYNLRFLESLQQFKQELSDRGRIGKILSVRCEIGQYLPGWRPAKDYRNTVSAQSKLGGGALLELSHELDLLRWVFGSVDWVSSWNGKLSSLEIDVEDCAYINLGFSSGVVGNLCMDFLRHDTTRCCTAIGEFGTLRWDGVVGTVSLFTPEANSWEILIERVPDRDASYREQIRAFLDAVVSRQLPPRASTGKDGLAVLDLVSAAIESAENSGQAVSVEKEAIE